MSKYIVFKNPTWDEVVVSEANGPQQAIRKASTGDEAAYVAVPLRNLTVIEAAVPDVPPVPALTFEEEDPEAWLAAKAPQPPQPFLVSSTISGNAG